MSERTDERTREPGGGEVDVDELLDDDLSGGTGGADAGDAGDADLDDGLGVDVDSLTSDPGASGPAKAESSSRSSLLGRLRPSVGNPLGNPLSAVPSPASFGLSLAVTVVSMLLVSGFLPLGSLGGMIGIFAGALLLGVVSGERRYLELTVSGAVAAAVSIVLGRLVFSALVGIAVPLAAVGAGGGAVAALLGHYFGRDIRDGLTREVE